MIGSAGTDYLRALEFVARALMDARESEDRVIVVAITRQEHVPAVFSVYSGSEEEHGENGNNQGWCRHRREKER